MVKLKHSFSVGFFTTLFAGAREDLRIVFVVSVGRKMTSALHFKFKSAKQFETLTFDGDFIKVADLKLAIVERKGLNFGEGFDLDIKDAQTGERK